MITAALLRQIMPNIGDRADVFAPLLSDVAEIYNIDSAKRQAAFLAHLAHESGEFKYMVELGTGAAYDTGSKAAALGNTPEDDNDGEKYKGRGPMQLTGHDNYKRCSLGIYGDERLLVTPELLEKPYDGCMSAGWFWDDKRLNSLADLGDFESITRKINGGLNGYAQRLKYYNAALAALS